MDGYHSASSSTDAALAHLTSKEGVLNRNRACHQCRKKKLKCDAEKPICTACKRVKRASGDEVECTWDEVKIPRRALQAMKRAEKERLKRAEMDSSSEPPVYDAKMKRRRVEELEGRLAEVEASFARRQQDLPSTDSPTSYSRAPQTPQVWYKPPDLFTSNVNQDHWSENIAPVGRTLPNGATLPTGEALPDLTFNYTRPIPAGVDLSSAPEPQVDDEWMQVIWPGWSPYLPAPHVVEHFVNVFFNRVHPFSKMLHRATFLQRLGLPPTHPKFPPRVILHAIVAAASRYTSSDALQGTGLHMFAIPKFKDGSTSSSSPNNNSSGSSPTSNTSEKPRVSCPYYPHDWVAPLEHREFANWHFAMAAEEIKSNLAVGKDLLASVQARVLLTMSHLYNASWQQSWADAGATLRMCPPLGLSDSANYTPENNFQMMVRTVANQLEGEERTRTFWMAFMLERVISMTSAFPTSLAEDDITREMPIAQEMFEAATERTKHGLEPNQSLHDTQFYTDHPTEHADSLNLLIKATRLCAMAAKFRRQFSRHRNKGETDYAKHPLVRMILGQAAVFRNSFPAHLRKIPTEQLADTDLLTANLMTQLVTLLIGESYIDASTWKSDLAQRIQQSLRTVLSVIYDLISTSYDLSLLCCVSNYVWLVAARCTLNFAMAARCSGDSAAMEVFLSEVEVYRLACEAFDMLAQWHAMTPDQSAQRNGNFMETGAAQPISMDGQPCTAKESDIAAEPHDKDNSQGPIVDFSTFDFEAASAQLGFSIR